MEQNPAIALRQFAQDIFFEVFLHSFYSRRIDTGGSAGGIRPCIEVTRLTKGLLHVLKGAIH